MASLPKNVRLGSRAGPVRTGRGTRLVAALSLGCLLGACTTGSGLFSNTNRDAAAPESSDRGSQVGAAALNAEGLAVYLETMRLLIEGDALTRAEIMRTVADGAEFAPTTTNRFKYALALAVPGHAGSNAAEAERRLAALLSAGDALLPEERILAAIQLRDVEQRLILDAAAEQLRTEMARAMAQQDAATTTRLQDLLDENRRLQTELDDATEKLNAITSIEQSIRERENGTE